MTVLASWQGWITLDGGRLAAMFDAAGTMSIEINGRTFTGAATNGGGLAYCDFDGFAPKETLSAKIFLDGVQQTINLARGTTTERPAWTQRNSGGLRILWLSCSNPSRNTVLALKYARALSPDLILYLGDTGYHEPENLTLFGVTRSNPEESLAAAQETTAAAWYANSHCLLKPSFADMSMLAPILMQWDDHEIFSDFRNSASEMALTNAMSTWSPALSTDAELDDILEARRTVARGVQKIGLRSDTDYWALDYGPARIICPDLVTEKGPRSGTTMMSAEQLAWYEAQLVTPHPFIFGAHTKTATNGNSDSWYDYGGLAGTGSQLKTLLQFIESNAIATWAVITGDLHHPHVQYNANPQSLGSPTAFSPYLGICPSAENQFDTAVGATLTGDIVFKRQGKVIGFLEIPDSQEYVEYQIRDFDSIWWRGRQYRGSNELVYPANWS